MDIFSLFKTKLHSIKILGNVLVAIHKIKTTWTLEKVAYFGICTIKLSKIPMYEFH